ncbi:MAG: hypothetical protein LBI02_08115 [Opitutaceae bacterium]|jgi:hypothetical protein|nr:hypothetical protein [Opitutaceae bacterium]
MPYAMRTMFLLSLFTIMQVGCASPSNLKTKTEILTQAFEEANAVWRERNIAIGKLVRSDYSAEAGRVYFEKWMPFFDALARVRREYFKAKLTLDPDSIDWKGSIRDWALREPYPQDISEISKKDPEAGKIIYASWKESLEVTKKLHEYLPHDAYVKLSNEYGGKWMAIIDKRLNTEAKLHAIEKRVRKEMKRASLR